MSRHSFDPEIAALVGVNSAILYQNLCYWIEKNEANGHNFKEGRYWTYNSIAAFAKLFPYFSEKQIRTALDKLLDAGLILKGNHSEDRYDRTAWYALADTTCPSGQIELPGREGDGFAPNGKGNALGGKSLENRYNPDTNPPSSPGSAATEADLDLIWAAYPDDRRRDRAVCSRLVAEALQEVSHAELLAAVKAYAAESEGFTRSKVSFSDNWLRDGKWRRYVSDARSQRATREASLAETLTRIASWVKSGSDLCRLISQDQISMALERGLVTREEVNAAGFKR